MDDIPRRVDLKRMTYAERLILDAVRAVEMMGADERLTDAVVTLQQARQHVADFVDDVPKDKPEPYRPGEQMIAASRAAFDKARNS
jgi:hypothetical protein